MQENNMYKELVFYLEACESGSMFTKLTADQNIRAVTASNATKPSYATYCGSDATVQGYNMKTCLGDLFAVNWMNDTLTHDITKEVLKDQIANVTKLTTKSPVQVFGDSDIDMEPVGDFEGIVDSPSVLVKSGPPKYMSLVGNFFEDAAEWTTDLVSKGMDYIYKKEQEEVEHIVSYDMQLHFLKNKMMEDNSEEAQQEFEAHMSHRLFFS